MNIAIIVAGGVGSRMVTSNIPKQFLKIKNKPIIIHTIEKFYFQLNISKIVISCNINWITHLQDLINFYKYEDKVEICIGGDSRNQSISNAIDYLVQQKKINDNDTILTHDAVRMFVSSEIIEKNINSCDYGCCVDTVIPATDTIVFSMDSNFIENIPNRNNYFHGQTPQTFKASDIVNIYKKNWDSEEFSKTDACRLAELNGIKIKLVFGDKENFKITSEFDLKLAEIMVKHD